MVYREMISALSSSVVGCFVSPEDAKDAPQAVHVEGVGSSFRCVKLGCGSGDKLPLTFKVFLKACISNIL